VDRSDRLTHAAPVPVGSNWTSQPPQWFLLKSNGWAEGAVPARNVLGGEIGEQFRQAGNRLLHQFSDLNADIFLNADILALIFWR
jgi:hypothetical protein